MKRTLLVFSFLPLFALTQKVSNSIEIEAGGANVLYGVGVSTYFKVKDSSKIGFRPSIGIYPLQWKSYSASLNYVPSIQLFYSPSKILRGKFTFRAGTSFYFRQSYHEWIEDPNGVIIGYTYSPNEIYHSFNVGATYNVLKKDSRLMLNIGLDCIIGFRDLSDGHIEAPVIPWPIIQYGIKF